MAIKAWSTTAASNVNALTGVGLGFDENQLPSLVNNAARELMAQIAAFVADAYTGKCPYYAAGGTANAITVTASPAATAYAAGQGFVILAGATNTGAVTLNVNALGTKAIQLCGTALKGGEIISGSLFMVYYDGTQFELMTTALYARENATYKHLGVGLGSFATSDGGNVDEGNTAIGNGALATITATSGKGATAVGEGALAAMTTGQGNTAVGRAAADAVTTGNQNTAIGNNALGAATSGGTNTAVGRSAGLAITTGDGNTIIGNTANGAATSTANATAVGNAAVAASGGLALGAGATAAANTLALGSSGTALTTQTTIGANGAASALTANPVGYLVVTLNGTDRIIPYYTK
jgi:hypothetical protein